MGPDSLVLDIRLSKQYGIHGRQDVQTVAQRFRCLFEPSHGSAFQRFYWLKTLLATS